LDDNYEYINENNNKKDVNDNKFNEIINNNINERNTSIEMGIKL
jgi:hypothetical protein